MPNKEYYAAHKEELLANNKQYNESHKAEKQANNKQYYESHKAERKANQKQYYESHKAEKKAYYRKYNKSHRKQKIDYEKTDLNSQGKTKNSIRKASRRYLFNTLKHTKLNGYEVHHCFGYDDYQRFIYIPRELHLQIHQFLRDNGIRADTDHFAQIAHLIYACERYVYIKV